VSLRPVKAAFALLIALHALLPEAGCGSSSGAGGPCDPAKCRAGNQCVDDGTGTSCHLVCATQTDCPFDFHCTPSLTSGDAGAVLNYCAADAKSYTPGPGTWGASCNPTGGMLKNPDCDASQGFACNAASPTDASAYCTQFSCTSDSDCRGGWWCATINAQPNATTSTRSMGQTVRVCEPRLYCSPCTADVDCSPSSGPEHCIADDQGGLYCAPECTGDSICNIEASCKTLDEKSACDGSNGPCVCVARANECVGDGKLCAPCRSDADCPMGLCVQADYSTEHFCTVTSGVPCMINGQNQLVDQCPSTDEANVDVGCTTTADGNDAPTNQCVGLTTLGTNPNTGKTQYVLGCFTPDR